MDLQHCNGKKPEIYLEIENSLSFEILVVRSSSIGFQNIKNGNCDEFIRPLSKTFQKNLKNDNNFFENNRNSEITIRASNETNSNDSTNFSETENMRKILAINILNKLMKEQKYIREIYKSAYLKLLDQKTNNDIMKELDLTKITKYFQKNSSDKSNLNDNIISNDFFISRKRKNNIKSKFIDKEVEKKLKNSNFQHNNFKK